MRQYLSFLALLVSLILVVGALCWAQCPEDPNDLGVCDTLIATFWDACECDSFPCFVHLSLLVTHDSNTFYWVPEGYWVQDSIIGMIMVLKFSHTNPAAYCSLPHWKNTISFTDTANSIFRHFGEMQNRMMYLHEETVGGEWDCIYFDTYFYEEWLLWLGLLRCEVPGAPEDQAWWEGTKTLLATMTFLVEDTMTICIDTALVPPDHLPPFFTRHDAVVYYPRHNMPYCATIKICKRGDADGDGEVHISDIVYLINYLFAGGHPPQPLAAGDANCDGVVDIADVIYLINYLFTGGPEPSC